ncbi:MAG TPA: thiamine diphosphokinase [Actinomycetota bacterium]|nr:thiamine diphosphokinase [Actinomycetota bacterium]
MRSAVVFCGGGPSRVRFDVPRDAFVVAADIGLAEATRLGVQVHLLVGDLDSVGPEDLGAFEEAGGKVRRHPEDKDETDLDLAIAEALGAGAEHVLVVGGDRGRLDHLLGNAWVLTSPRHGGARIDAILGAARLHVVRGSRELSGSEGEIVSLFALGGPASGVSTEGLRWVLEDATLEPGSSLGISNEFSGDSASIEVRDGVVLAVRPGAADPS